MGSMPLAIGATVNATAYSGSPTNSTDLVIAGANYGAQTYRVTGTYAANATTIDAWVASTTVTAR